MTKIDDLEARMVKFASDLGETRGKLDALDDRVAHNCQRNEDNFAKLDAKVDTLSSKVIEAITASATRDEKVAEQVATLTQLNSDLKIKVVARKVVIFAFIVVGILSFLGGSLVKWTKVEDFFDRTTVQQRADMVKDGIKTAGELTK